MSPTKPASNRNTPPPPPDQRAFTTPQTVAYLRKTYNIQFSDSKLRKGCMRPRPEKPDEYRPDIPQPTKIGGRVFFFQADIDAFVRAHRKIDPWREAG
jgi:hypothetical protein